MKNFDDNDKNDDELDYNIIFNDEIADIADNDLISETDDSSCSQEDALYNQKKNNTQTNFYSNYFNPKLNTDNNAHICTDENCESAKNDSGNALHKNCADHCDCHNHQCTHTSATKFCDDKSAFANEEEYNNARAENLKNKLSKYKDYEFDDETDFSCVLDPNKTCDNCGMCLDSFNTDEEGFAQIKIDGIDNSKVTLEELYKMYGLDDD